MAPEIRQDLLQHVFYTDVSLVFDPLSQNLSLNQSPSLIHHTGHFP